MDLMPWRGWPLRPFFFPEQLMQSVSAGVHEIVGGWCQKAAARSAQDLSQELGLDVEFLKRISTREAFSSPNFTHYMRPDGFLSTEGFVFCEINFGNGLSVSNSYTDVLADYHSQDGLSYPPLLRPFQRYLDLLQELLNQSESSQATPRVGLLSHSHEYKVIHSWQKRVGDLVAHARHLMVRRGWEPIVLHEDDVFLDDRGQACWKRDGRALDLIACITINTSFMDEPERFEREYAHWAGCQVGRTPFFKPLAALCLDKGTLASLRPSSQSDVDVRPAETHFPLARRAAEYRLERERFVLKRAFDGKDTYVGTSCNGRIWNRMIQRVLDGKDYVMQSYHPMPQTLLPISTDGTDLQWVQVSFEFSPFLVGGEFAGGIVRYAPAKEGLIMSPPPEDMGLGIALAV